MSDLGLSRIFDVDPQQVWFFLGDVLRNPTSNLTAFVLVLALITGFVLLLILGLILVGMQGPADRRRPAVLGGASEEGGSSSGSGAPKPKAPLVVVAAAWTLAFLLVWLFTGVVSGQDAVCLSCHVDDAPHALRFEDPERDPHGRVSCAACHESASALVRATSALVPRAVHYVTSSVDEGLGAGYGSPVASRTCASCHGQVLKVTSENPDRGVRMSHAEPLEVGARCADCHMIHEVSGVVDRLTVGMDPCLRCHDGEQASAECASCHTKDVGYAVHARGVVSPRTQVKDITCGGCHSEESCDACHGIRMPHTEAFKGAGHARVAAEDVWYNGGRMCEGCHTESRRPCSSCHRTAFPAHGGRSFARDHQAADPYDNGCDNCHNYRKWMVGRNFCANCHPQYAPNQIVVPRER